MKNNIITVDCDGIIMENIWGRNWTNQAKKDNQTWFYEMMNLAWATLNHQWRKPLPGIERVLIKLERDGYKLILVTSRKEYMKPLTLWWLKKWGLERYFRGYYFNNFGVTAVESKVKNIGQIGPAAHIDDNEETVKQLNLEYKNLKIFWLNPKPPILRQTQDTSLEEGGPTGKNIIWVGSWGEIGRKVQDIQDK